MTTPDQTSNGQILAPISQLFSDSFALYKERFLTLTILFSIPYLFFGSGVLLVASGVALGVFIIILSFLLFTPASISVISALFRRTGVAQSLRVGFSLFFPALWVSILIFFILIGGYTMLIVPGILMSLWFLFSSFALVIEGKRGLNALLRSREYVRGHLGAICVRFFIIFFISFAAHLAIYWLSGLQITTEMIMTTVTMITGVPLSTGIYMVINTIIAIFIGPFTIVYLYKIYQNLTALKPELALVASQPAHDREVFTTISFIAGLVVLWLLIDFVIGFGEAFH